MWWRFGHVYGFNNDGTQNQTNLLLDGDDTYLLQKQLLLSKWMIDNTTNDKRAMYVETSRCKNINSNHWIFRPSKNICKFNKQFISSLLTCSISEKIPTNKHCHKTQLFPCKTRVARGFMGCSVSETWILWKRSASKISFLKHPPEKSELPQPVFTDIRK